ncbi:efflux RND transporter periplasmic adaptor subunit [Billgrantia kenyensis]|uniref:Efflux RND transporter periplasmic adaptor subunit n=1 Tax=Billgrantia kenyensis TaxID=321266 RepID=A0A7W0ADN5_9GAMM|nr:efflux RND transporter periplasmic adaptor subunit [Halomonas kenyensis]MBA2778705.1 efflux RND transporter periplasmic adaptor subunit [Halomonas kenyensis]MCG6661767.1 efflux RND transporter periplasmic adaptor subunit [Halomonas kenyensis]
MIMRHIVLLAVLVLLVGCADEPVEESPLRPVRTLIVEASGVAGERELPGRLEAAANRRMSFRVAGQLEAFEVTVGERVEAGQRLARLEATDLRLQRDRARSALAGSQAAAANAEAEWQRARRLYEAGSVPARDLDAARAQVEASRAQRDGARDALALAERQLGFAHLEAPGDCRVANRPVEAGENVGAGQPVLVLACGDELEVRAALSEDLLGTLVAGAPVGVRLPLADLTLAGEVTEIGLPVDPRQATWPLRVRLLGLTEEVRDRLRPGMAAELTLPLGGPGSGIWVPMVAVQRDIDGHFVYVAEEKVAEPAEGDTSHGNRSREARVVRQAVTLGGRHGERLEVLAGLEPGQQLIVAGMSRLHDGMRVRLIDDRRADGEGAP